MSKKKGRRKKDQKYPQDTRLIQGTSSNPPCRGKLEGSLCFEFPDGWHIEKYDAWTFVKMIKMVSILGSMESRIVVSVPWTFVPLMLNQICGLSR